MQNHRAQINQVFIFLVAIIIIIATVFLGGKLLGFFTTTACSVSDSSFATDLKNELDANAAYGSRNTISVAAPCNAQELYLIDAGAIGGTTPIITGNDQIDALLQNGVKTNIYVVKDGVAEPAGEDVRIIVGRESQQPIIADPVVKVAQSRGGFSFLVEGFGRTIRVGNS